MSGFCVTGHKGVRLTFANGVRISIQWGPGNYCDVYPFNRDYDAPAIDDAWSSPDAEIALFWEGGGWLTKEAAKDLTGQELSDDVIGWLSPDEVARYIAWAQAHAPKVTP